MHISVPIENTIELLNFTPFNPLISKCEIKVCYVGEDPNRNGSVITKAVAADMAKTLPGCPIVGFYNQATGDFEEHNRMIDVSNGKFEVIDTTRPYGFVDKNAKVWFQKFNDDGIEHEYLMTEGWIWTGVYPESQRIIEHGNNQSMELHKKLTKGKWTTDDKGMPKFFIINEAIIQKLCILGENVEPCFEGAGIAAQFSFDDDFKNTMYSMIEELQTALQEGGITQMDEEEKVTSTEEVEFKKKDEEDEEKNPSEKDNDEEKNPSEKDNDDSEDKADSDDSEKDDDDEEEKKKKKLNHSASEENADKCSKCNKPKAECTCKEDEKKNYSLTEIPEYIELQNNYSALEQKYNDLVAEITPLREFKAAADKKEKQAMIDSFYMLSDADKADVITNIDTYSVNDIEAKLAIICVRNKVSFSLEDDKKDEESDPLIYSLGNDTNGDNAPAWIKAVRETAKNM